MYRKPNKSHHHQYHSLEVLAKKDNLSSSVVVVTKAEANEVKYRRGISRGDNGPAHPVDESNQECDPLNGSHCIKKR